MRAVWENKTKRIPAAARAICLAMLLLAVSFCGYFAQATLAEVIAPDQIILTWTEDPTTSQTITWLMSDDVTACVQYIKADEFNNNFDAAMQVDASGTLFDSTNYRYSVNISGLTPDTQYIYRVGSEGAWSEVASFTTAADTDDFSFLYMGDVQGGYAEWGAMAGDVYQSCPDIRFSLMGGDLTDNGYDAVEWGQFLDAATGIFSRIPVIPTMGNHDGYMYLNFFALSDNGPAGMEQQFYSFDYGNAHFVVLNSSYNTDEAVKQWLQEDLQSSTQTWKFAMFHHPAYPAFEDYKTIDESICENWVPILEQNGVDMVFVGHQHEYMRTYPIYQGEIEADSDSYGIVYVMGNAGSKIYVAGADFPYIAREETGSNYQVIDIDGDIMTMTSTKADGELIESYTIDKSQPIDVLYDGTVNLTPDGTFDVTAYNSETAYTISETTPLGALNAAAAAGGFSYDVTDKRWTYDGVLLLDNVGTYFRDKTNGVYWYAYVNDVYKDGYANNPDGLNVIQLADGDRAEFYYAGGITDPTDLDAVKAAAIAAVKTVASVEESSTMGVLYDGTVNLTPDGTFDVTAYSSETVYTISETTPLGALNAAAAAGGFSYDVTDKRWTYDGVLLLDNVGTYFRDKTNGVYWYAYVNDVYKDGYANNPDGLNIIQLADGDRVEFYYAGGITDPADLAAVKAAAIAAVKTVAVTGVAPTEWTLQLSGAKDTSITRAYFEEALACSYSGHQVFWTDTDNNIWGGVPLWLLVGMVDDDPDVGPNHFNFNDELAAQGYQVNVISGDGWSATLDSDAIDRNDGYIVANTLNGEVLPQLTESEKPCWPLYLKGSAVFGGQQVGNITRIELSGFPQPHEGWTLEMIGDVGDTITQEEFEAGLACTASDHYREWTDIDGNTWSGVPLWVLLGAVDDIETGSHWTFNDTVAAAGYSINVVAGDGFSRTFTSTDAARSDAYIVANMFNGAPLTDSWPLRLVGDGVTGEDGSLSGASVGNIVKIEIPDLQTPAADEGEWNLSLSGKISDVISQAEFEAALSCPNSGHLAQWTDIDGNVWSGIPLWYLTGWVDDRQPHDYYANQAMAGYTILVKAGDGYNKDFVSTDVAWSNDYIVANKFNGAPLTDSWPLRLVGAGVAGDDGSLGGTSVGNITAIELKDFDTALPVPEVHVIKYAADGTTIINEMTCDYAWMQKNLDIIGDGSTVYYYEGITNNPDDVWDADETYPGGFKMANAVKGTRVRDLCDQVGGMGAGTEIVFTAKDGYESRLPYSSIYTDPAVQARQGDAIVAWWADGQYVPYYADGMRLFFTPDGDNVYGQWDMHETLPSAYWHYYYADNVQYPSCAGLSAKYITTIEIYSAPASDWTLELDGRDIGGIEYDISKTYFEQALACQFGSNHKATYTDSQDQVWEGMPLWFLAGFVDDADQHSDNAFNDELALAGYQVVITAVDGYSVTINSADIIRTSDYIVANSLNGETLPDDYWPLRLIGPVVSGGTSISQIVRIELVTSALLDPPALTADDTDNMVGRSVDITFTDDADWRAAITRITVDGSTLDGSRYTVTAGNINIAAEVFTAADDYEVVVSAAGYDDASIIQTMVEEALLTAPELIADSSANRTGMKVDIKFADDADWRAVITGIYVNGRVLTEDQYKISKGKIRIYGTVFTEAGDYDILVEAEDYSDAELTQTIENKKNIKQE